MNDEFRNDPALQSLEARLIAHRPKLPDREFGDLFYQCAFAAGRKSAKGSTRRWQLASVAMAVVLLVTGFPMVRERLLVPRPGPSTNQSATVAQVPIPRNVSASLSHIAAVPLDAWQVRANVDTTFDSELTKFKRTNVKSRSLAVGTRMRAVEPIP